MIGYHFRTVTILSAQKNDVHCIYRLRQQLPEELERESFEQRISTEVKLAETATDAEGLTRLAYADRLLESQKRCMSRPCLWNPEKEST